MVPRRARPTRLDGYSATCLRRVWRAAALLVVDDVDAAPLHDDDRVRSSSSSFRSCAMSCSSRGGGDGLAENYVGLEQV